MKFTVLLKVIAQHRLLRRLELIFQTKARLW